MSGQGFGESRVSQNREHIVRTYPFKVPVHHAIGVEIVKPLRYLAELRMKICVSKQSVAGLRDDGTKRIRESSGFESRY